MNSIYSEVANVALFFKMLLTVGVFTGLILVPVIVIGYELQTKRKA